MRPSDVERFLQGSSASRKHDNAQNLGKTIKHRAASIDFICDACSLPWHYLNGGINACRQITWEPECSSHAECDYWIKSVIRPGDCISSNGNTSPERYTDDRDMTGQSQRPKSTLECLLVVSIRLFSAAWTQWSALIEYECVHACSILIRGASLWAGSKTSSTPATVFFQGSAFNLYAVTELDRMLPRHPRGSGCDEMEGGNNALNHSPSSKSCQ
ncbi:uncharacterized protein BCR38DRAFT_177392 [Pseudomassariella vexata]|uniref:Uncharacterized protein n=1 Tax=Pseudomassariella vexata TaxID=1141098 RepID=A0A1Y2E487_9PEZI|nr:uncharacterized protein BCR38DRAFT_177392 [Pseudomassariella vexata]ORY66329.1 hypothetical protein BCR38DRAFT_177392 [Pseudomassariella vexata]